MSVLRGIAAGVCRLAVLLVLVCAGTVLLMRLAPGYAVDVAELDGVHGAAARAGEAAVLRSRGTLQADALRTVQDLFHGDLGVSRQYGLPVRDLLRPRLARSGRLLMWGLLGGWVAASASALLRLVSRWAGAGPAVLLTVLLAVPAGALSTLLLGAGMGGPAVSLALVVAARDFHFLDVLFQEAWSTEALLHARCGGVARSTLLLTHFLPAVLPRLRALVPLSVVTALGALLPVEVLFDTGGLAQLAWSAAGNRDLPVLLAVTLLLAAVVACSGWLAEPDAALEAL